MVDLKEVVALCSGVATGAGTIAVAVAIWWAQRERSVSITSDMHLGRKEDRLAAELQQLRKEVSNLRKAVSKRN